MDDDLTVAEAAELVGLSAARVRALAQAGELPARKVGRDWLIRRRDAARFADKARPKPGPKAKAK